MLGLVDQLAMKQGDIPLAHSYYRAALALYTDFGNKPLALHVQQKLAELGVD